MLKMNCKAISGIRECRVLLTDIKWMIKAKPEKKSMSDLKLQASETKINEEAYDDSGTDSDYIYSSEAISSSDDSTASDYEQNTKQNCTVSASSSRKCLKSGINSELPEINSEFSEISSEFPGINSEFSVINSELSDVNSELSIGTTSKYSNQPTSIEDNIENIPSFVNSSDMKRKKHFCLYCKTLYVNIPRHLETVHFNEEEVKKILALPKCTKISETNVDNNTPMKVVSKENSSSDIFNLDSEEAAGCYGDSQPAISRQYVNERTPTKDRKTHAGSNKIRRISWTTPERHTVRSKLMIHFQNDTLPSLEECYNLIRDNPSLSNRTAQQIRLWVFNQKRAKLESTINSGRYTWRTPEKHAFRKYFRKHILEGRTPNNAECHKALLLYRSELQGRNVPVIKSWVAAEIKRQQSA